MTDHENISAVADDVLEKVRDIESVLSNLRLELANIALIRGVLDDVTTDRLSRVTKDLARLSLLSLESVDMVNRVVGGEDVYHSLEKQISSQDFPAQGVEKWPRNGNEPHGWNRRMDELRGRLREGQFYEGIIDPAIVPSPEFPEGETALEITILSDNRIRVNGEDILLEEENLFIFNTFMYLREFAVSGAIMKQFGFRSKDLRQPDQRFTKGLQNVRLSISKFANFPAIERWGVGVGTRYKVSDRIILTDRRQEVEPHVIDEPVIQLELVLPDKQPAQVPSVPRSKTLEAKNPLVKATQSVRPPSVPKPFNNLLDVADDTFETEITDDQDLALEIILEKYKSHPRVQSTIDSYKISDSPENRKRDDGYKVDDAEVNQYRQLSYEERAELFRRIDEGLETYDTLDSLDNLSESQEESLIAFACAHQVIFYTNQGLVRKFMQNYPSSSKTLTRMDALREANIGLTRAIVYFDVKKSSTFSTYATKWINQVVKQAITDRKRTIPIPREKSPQRSK